ncbi:hypothetical protein [Phenylobacterium sp.]|uniref:hypothetical protein n=1 Tax=Phenylobacterium sp. TaxID=1871053 RepID=UPI0027365B24|nr:hypothetical protein [Phenylobacterium sp.]MDP3854382.1 hypothetical protein [Phenylobacterium sp.]
MAISAIGASALAAETPYFCPPPYWPAGRTPGLEIGDLLGTMTGRVPKSSGCYDPRRVVCAFRDKHGYTNHFGSNDADGVEERVLLSKVALRAQAAQLPFGVLWTDSRATVKRRLKVIQRPGWSHEDSDTISTSTCGSPQSDSMYTTFKFDRAGRLISMEQSIQV